MESTFCEVGMRLPGMDRSLQCRPDERFSAFNLIGPQFSYQSNGDHDESIVWVTGKAGTWYNLGLCEFSHILPRPGTSEARLGSKPQSASTLSAERFLLSHPLAFCCCCLLSWDGILEGHFQMLWLKFSETHIACTRAEGTTLRVCGSRWEGMGRLVNS